jgi:hypothetical protein
MDGVQTWQLTQEMCPVSVQVRQAGIHLDQAPGARRRDCRQLLKGIQRRLPVEVPGDVTVQS